jgi:hypothetical protein
MRSLLLAVTFAIAVAPAWAEEVTGPKEVGSTTMPPGQYYVTEQISNKSYSLTVTDKGNMILGPAPAGVEVRVGSAGGAAGAAGAAGAVAGSAATTAAVTTGSPTAAATPQNVANDALKGLMKQGMQRGMSELVKQGGTKQLQKYMK